MWFDDLNTSKFWEVGIERHERFDSITIQHIYPSRSQHDNAVLRFWITVPHDPVKTLKFTSFDGTPGNPIIMSPADPDFFEYLRRYTNRAITALMEDMNGRLNRGLRFEGVYAKQ